MTALTFAWCQYMQETFQNHSVGLSRWLGGLKHLVLLQKDPGSDPQQLHCGLQLSVTLIPRNLTSSSGLHRHQIHMQYRYPCRQNTSLKKIKLKNFNVWELLKCILFSNTIICNSVTILLYTLSI